MYSLIILPLSSHLVLMLKLTAGANTEQTNSAPIVHLSHVIIPDCSLDDRNGVKTAVNQYSL